MKHLVLLFAAFALAACLSPVASAQAPAAGVQPPASNATPPPAMSDAGKAKAALDMLKDDAQRAKLIAALEAIIQAQGRTQQAPAGAVPAIIDVPAIPAPASPPAAPAPAAPPAIPAPATPAKPPATALIAAPLLPDGVGALLFDSTTRWLAGRAQDVVNLSKSVTDFPLLWAWLTRLATDRTLQLAILDTAWRLILVLGLGLVAEWAVARALRGQMRSLHERAPPVSIELDDDVAGIAEAEAGQTEWTRRRASVLHVARRLPYAAAHFVLGLLPLGAVVMTANLLAGYTGTITARQVILEVLQAYVVWRLVVAVAEAVAAPGRPRLRLIPVDDDQAVVISKDTRLLAGVALFGAVAADVAQLFGLYRIAHEALLKVDALAVYLLVVNIMQRNRRGLRDMLRPKHADGGMLSALRLGLASSWHRIIVFYLFALWTVWALDISDGFARLLHFMIETVTVVAAAQVLSLLARAAIKRMLRGADGLDERYPGAEARIAMYHPLLRGIANIAISIIAALVLLDAWGFKVTDWFAQGTVGHQLLGALETIAITIALALAVWEASNIAIARHLAKLARDAQLSRSARLQTLLPMARTTLLVTVFVVAGLIVLSELGVNIGPLLAGAGVIGIAIGFGSQKLVQDIITGLFLLLENAMQVGDWVTLGGLSGTVENLSIRTIRLRAVDGAMHTVPFSAVTTVTNSTKDYGFTVVDVTVGLNEQPDRIAEILRDVATGMRREPAWRGLILADIEILGVERFVVAAWVLRARMKTLPASRWAVGRELNRRIKYRFDELAIESPITSYRALGLTSPQPQIIMDQGSNVA